jgi:membrane-bound lytic murein transglycosylase B
MRLTRPIFMAAYLTAAAVTGAAAQNARDDRYPATTGAIPPVAAKPQSSAQQWSGESGASGHPLMTAEAIRAAAANFHGCLESLWPAAAHRGISRAVFQAQTASLKPDLRIMDLLDNQPEFTKSFWDYLDILVNENRIQKGRDVLAKYRQTFDAVEKAYGVDRHVIAAIWGVETNYGSPIDRDAGMRRPAPALFPR